MATLKDYFVDKNCLDKFIHEYSLKYFIETGTGYGETVGFVKGSFKKVFSIEVIKEIYEGARIKFENDTNVYLINKLSTYGLVEFLKEDDLNSPILFFLDAHFPGADFGFAKYDSEKDKDKRIPLQKELETIVRLRGDLIKKDCFIIDDLRVYEDGPFGDGNWPKRKELGGDGIDFVYDLFAETHYIERDYRYQGFIILTPML
jgi:hypothetical protein